MVYCNRNQITFPIKSFGFINIDFEENLSLLNISFDLLNVYITGLRGGVSDVESQE
jgi:hypothetical protein